MLVLAGVELSAGWVSLASIVLRIALSVSAAVVLVGSTGMPALCAALARLGVPRVFTLQLLFLHRYLFVLVGEAQRLSTALDLRALSGRCAYFAVVRYVDLPQAIGSFVTGLVQ